MYEICSFLNVTLVWLPIGPPFTSDFASKNTGSAPVILHITGKSLQETESSCMFCHSIFVCETVKPTCTWISHQIVSDWIVGAFLISLQQRRFQLNLQFDLLVCYSDWQNFSAPILDWLAQYCWKKCIYWSFTTAEGLIYIVRYFLFSIWNGVMTKYPIEESCCVNRPPFCSSFGVINDLGPMISSRSWRNFPLTRTGLYSIESKSEKLNGKTIRTFTAYSFIQLLLWQIYR